MNITLPLFPLPAVLAVVGGCDRMNEPPHDPRADRARVRVAVAFAGAELALTPDGPDEPGDGTPDPDCRTCGGTGTTRTGDGLAEVPCGCLTRPRTPARAATGPAAPPATSARAGAPVRVLVFTAAWCGPCRAMTPALAEAESRCGPGVRWRVVDVDREPETAAGYRVTRVPTLVREAAGRETARTTGARDAAGLVRFARGT